MRLQSSASSYKSSRDIDWVLHLLTPPTASQVYLPSCCCRQTPSGSERVSVHDPLAPTGSELADSHQGYYQQPSASCSPSYRICLPVAARRATTAPCQ
ncbi:hypothetical protein PCASD_05693 [Puccinia coronata f. sp. avenae]|uniref:Uncharacterized protein n=1 Tax=Puccinia coronata f. sp. avenae TaxID=200324 RepID=A0A2N5UVG8_9BASI|nr:hypothetical protein PCASD_05693 [Puccinia coronata f. sp. avenae]